VRLGRPVLGTKLMWLSGVGGRPRRSFSLCIQIVSKFHRSRHFVYEERAEYLNFAVTANPVYSHVMHILLKRIPPRGETGVSNKLQALSSARLESW